MADVQWIKIATQIFDNRKIKQIEKMPEGDAIIVVWFKLLCLAGTCNKNGMVFLTEEIPYTEETLAVEFGMEQRLNILKLALKTFQRFKMIEIIDDVFYVSSWDKYQNIEGLEKIREQNRIRQARFKENQKLLQDNVISNVTGNSEVTQCNATDIEEDKEIDKDIKHKKSSRFAPPSLQEVQAYCKERNNGIDAENFIAFYSSKDWMIGKNKMKDWKSAIITWEKRGKKPDQQQTKNKQLNFPQRQYTPQAMDDLERKLLNRGL